MVIEKIFSHGDPAKQAPVSERLGSQSAQLLSGLCQSDNYICEEVFPVYEQCVQYAGKLHTGSLTTSLNANAQKFEINHIFCEIGVKVV